MIDNWQDPDGWKNPEDWGGWFTCDWEADRDDNGISWACLLPARHTGPHLGVAGWETEPYHEENVIEKNGVWVEGDMCHFCNRQHPGFRHANDNDTVVIALNDDGWWEPQPLASKMSDWRELFVPIMDPFVPLPTPPTFATIEEADAWLEAHAR